MADKKAPGLKRRDIQKCIVCGLGVAHDGNFTFYRIKLERFMLDGRAIRQRHGLEEYFGGGAGGAFLAEHMGTDADLAASISDEEVALVCDHCSMKQVFIAVIQEKLTEQRAVKNATAEQPAEQPHE